MYLYNSLTKKKEVFYPSDPKEVKMYCCGPTVYSYAHIGNLRSYVFEDILRRALEENAYKVKHIVNLTDVGHLTSDADEGEDKMEKAKKKENKNAWNIAEFYIKEFKKDWHKLNIKEPSLWTRATDYIDEQIKIISILEDKGFTYKIDDGIYFDTSKISDYGILANLDLENLKEGARVDFNPEKRNKTDFALWKFSPKDKKRDMEWKSPWGIGFPGWHTECVAMSLKNLGSNDDYTKTKAFDIHCGGIDHLTVHHPNEMAQCEALANHKMANYWLHNEFVLSSSSGKMSKSRDNYLRLKTLEDNAYHALSYRYLLLTSHYRSKLNFSFKALNSAQKAFVKILKFLQSKKTNNGDIHQNYVEFFINAIDDDLNTAKALAIMWDLLKNDDISDDDTYQTLLLFDKILGLRFNEADKVLEEIKKLEIIPDKIKALAEQRWLAKSHKHWGEADRLRLEVENQGYWILDKADSYEIRKKYD